MTNKVRPPRTEAKPPPNESHGENHGEVVSVSPGRSSKSQSRVRGPRSLHRRQALAPRCGVVFGVLPKARSQAEPRSELHDAEPAATPRLRARSISNRGSRKPQTTDAAEDVGRARKAPAPTQAPGGLSIAEARSGFDVALGRFLGIVYKPLTTRARDSTAPCSIGNTPDVLRRYQFGMASVTSRRAS